MTYKDYCPNCDYPLMIEEERTHYRITDYENTVTSCPNCLAPLLVEGSVLVVDEARVG